MSLRNKLLFMVVLLISVTMLSNAAFFIFMQRSLLMDEAKLKAQAFLAGFELHAVGALAGGRTEDLESLISRVKDKDLAELDVAFVQVIDHDGYVLAHTEGAKVGRLAGDSFSRDAFVSEFPLSMVTTGQDGADILLTSRPVVTAVAGHRPIRWGTLIAATVLTKVNEGIWLGLARIAIIALVFTALGSIVLSRLLTAALVHPVQKLAGVAQRFAAGQLDARAEVETAMEYGVLSRTFNDMAARIEDYTHGLEDAIKARTSELETSNSLLSKAMEELKQANSKLEEQATTDGLTGLANYRHFKTVFELEVRRARRVGYPLALVMADVDHFKIYNDTNGHPAGDEVLRKVAGALSQRLRQTDLACRYGGEEFVLILVNARLQEAAQVAEDIRAQIEQMPFAGEEKQPSGRLTISMGVSVLDPTNDAPETLLSRTDQALYQAKHQGRNRVVTV